MTQTALKTIVPLTVCCVQPTQTIVSSWDALLPTYLSPCWHDILMTLCLTPPSFHCLTSSISVSFFSACLSHHTRRLPLFPPRSICSPCFLCLTDASAPRPTDCLYATSLASGAVCALCCAAYANNRESSVLMPLLSSASDCCCVIEHRLSEEIGDGDQPLSETSFFRAMKLARGTVSVVDANGVIWSRIWCGKLREPHCCHGQYSLCSLFVVCVPLAGSLCELCCAVQCTTCFSH